MTDINDVFVAINIVGAVGIAVLMLVTTPLASIERAIHGDRQSAWALMRRFLYVSVAGGLFGMGVWVGARWFTPPLAVAVFWLMVAIPIGVFLLLRGTGVVDQDRWIGFWRSRH